MSTPNCCGRPTGFNRAGGYRSPVTTQPGYLAFAFPVGLQRSRECTLGDFVTYSQKLQGQNLASTRPGICILGDLRFA
jgi:hypothetical protein